MFVNNGVWCRILHTVNTYLLLSTYCWMLCEAVFLIMILLKTVLEEESLLTKLSLFGWGAPIMMMVPYIKYRLEYEDTNCWMQKGTSDIFLYIPVLIIILLNFITLAIVVKIIKSSTTFQQHHRQRSSANSDPRSPSGSEAPRLVTPGLRQASRAVLMLTPVFGLHLLLLPVSPDPDSAWEKVHAVISALSTSTQGTVVSCILCFANKEVMAKLKGYLQRKFSRNNTMESNNRRIQRVKMHGQTSSVTSFTRVSSIS